MKLINSPFISSQSCVSEEWLRLAGESSDDEEGDGKFEGFTDIDLQMDRINPLAAKPVLTLWLLSLF